MTQEPKKYDVVLSFAGEDRKYAEELAEALVKREITVFYDGYEKAKLWGKNLYNYLSDIYQNQARYCVMFLSEHYAEKVWTNHEREAAQARAFKENMEYILPVRLDSTEIPGILPTIAYLNWSDESPERISDYIVAKLQQKPLPVSSTQGIRRKHPVSWIELQPEYYEPFDAIDGDPEKLKGIVNDMWLPRKDEVWESTIAEGLYRLNNLTDSTAVKYIYVGLHERDVSNAPVSVEVKSNVSGNMLFTGAGLIYRFDTQSRFYYAFTLTEGERMAFYKRSSGGYKVLYSGRSNLIESNHLNKVGLIGDGSLFYLYINDTLVKTIKDAELETGMTGIIAMGSGEFFFDNFTIYGP
jgi:TIR domain